jgi:hypothetical protein
MKHPRLRRFDPATEWDRASYETAEGNGPFSIQNICDALEIDLCRLRRGVLHWRDRELGGEASRMIRRPPVLPVKQASGSAAMSRRKKIRGINSAKAG